MIEKSYEREYKGYLMKSYHCDSIYGVIDDIISSNINFSSVEVTDKGDVGMRYFGGQYTYETFLQMYDGIKQDIDTLSLKMYDGEGSIEISTDDGSVILLTKDKSLELENLIKKNKEL